MMSYCKAFSKQMNHNFTTETIRMTALTGSASVEIGGDTTARIFGLMKKKPMQFDDFGPFEDTRLNIVDEIGFAGQQTLKSLNDKLQEFTNCNSQMYGNIAIVFIGDFCQLPTIGQKRLFDTELPSLYWELALNQLVELEGHHRYADDPQLGNAMASARDGDAKALRTILKERIIKPNNLIIPPNAEARYATHTNLARASINALIFKQYLETYHHTDRNTSAIPKGTLIIRGTGAWCKPLKKMGHYAQKILWETCNDSHVKCGNTLADPFLCLFYGCEMMVNDNIDVKNGIANGTCCQFEKAVLKPGHNVEQMQVHGRWVNTVDINNIEYIVLRFDASYNPRFNGTFKLRARDKTFEVMYPTDIHLLGTNRIKASIKLKHFPIIGNFATTAHKLQGKTMSNLVISEWSSTDNWAYVVLSRVRTRAGLFLVQALPENISFLPNETYNLMMQRFRATIEATELPSPE